jgi:hypothetical protein
VAHIWRSEKPHGIGEDHRLLLAERRRQPDSEMVGAVMVVVELREELSAHAPRGLAPRELFGGVGKRQAYFTQPIDGRSAFRHWPAGLPHESSSSSAFAAARFAVSKPSVKRA